ncbi:MAG: AmmeMemoRadiSam system protein B [Chloroflexi bacterium]|nr:AmmeMemoRadiSam system protein B [Chloroflexota bacterium]
MFNGEIDIRPSPIAGTWYSDRPAVLQQEINDYLSRVKSPVIEGKIIGLIAPHAGYRYSGPTAAFAYRAVQGLQFDIVAILSPFHAYTPEELLTTRHSAYQTPLGIIPIDRELLHDFEQRLVENEIFVTEISRDGEHSLEIQLPFLQVTLDEKFHLFPLMIRTHDPQKIEVIAQAAATVLKGRNALIIASTDLSHFYEQRTANMFDKEMLQRIETLAPDQVLEAERDGKGFACGAGAVAAVLRITQLLGASKVQVLHYRTSGDETGDFSSVVGYGAAAIEIMETTQQT